jgi:hypothetical protein
MRAVFWPQHRSGICRFIPDLTVGAGRDHVSCGNSKSALSPDIGGPRLDQAGADEKMVT